MEIHYILMTDSIVEPDPSPAALRRKNRTKEQTELQDQGIRSVANLSLKYAQQPAILGMRNPCLILAMYFDWV